MINVESLGNDFCEYINNLASELLLDLRQDSSKQKPSEMNGTRPDGKAMPDVIPGMTTVGEVDMEGRKISHYFEANDTFIGLEKESYLKAKRLITTCLKRRDIYSKITDGSIHHELFWWIKACYTGKELDTKNFIGHLIERINKLTKTHKVQIAIAYLDVEEPLVVGDVTFGKLTEAEFAAYESMVKAERPEEITQRIEQLNQLKNRYRVFTYATTMVEAEEDKAIEIAREKVENALTTLRYVSISAFEPSIPSYFSISGENDVKITNIIVSSVGHLPTVRSSLDEAKRHEWKIGKEQIYFFHHDSTFQAVSRIMMEPLQSTELEDLLKSCFRLFGQSVRSQDPQLKIVFLLVVIESLLSKDTSEPVQFTVGLRLAYLLTDNPTERKEIDSILKSTYKLRSGFLHHGGTGIDYDQVKKIQIHVIDCLSRIALDSSLWKVETNLSIIFRTE